MKTEHLKALIPSADVREYMQQTGGTLTDEQKAVLLVHGGLPLEETCAMLRELLDKAAERELRGKISAYLEQVDRNLRLFRENEKRDHIYLLKTVDEELSYAERQIPTGYFYDWETAVSYGKRTGLPFTVEKHPVCGGRDDKKRPDEEYQDCVAALCGFGKEGELYWTDSNAEETDEMLSDRGQPLEDLFTEVPNPFEKGDIVRLAGEEKYGIVDTSQKAWQEKLQKIRARRQDRQEVLQDWSDVEIRVEFLNQDGTFSHSHVNPIDLERYRPEEDWQSADPMDQLLLQASLVHRGEGSLDELYYFTIQYRNSME